LSDTARSLFADIQLETREFALEIALECRPGITALYGPSGSGKSLTLSCLAGFARARGRIQLGAATLQNGGIFVPAKDRKLGYVPQNGRLFPHLTLSENILFANPSLCSGGVENRLAEFQLKEFAHRQPHQLSGGQEQRGLIARALATNPKALLLDEPARGLDAPLRQEFHAILRTFHEWKALPILLVTHDLDECLTLADRLYVLEKGKLIAHGNTADVVDRPESLRLVEILGRDHIVKQNDEVVAYRPHLAIARANAEGQFLVSQRPSRFGFQIEFPHGWLVESQQPLSPSQRYQVEIPETAGRWFDHAGQPKPAVSKLVEMSNHAPT
jgi:molybdate transport system ATP-binding protein